LLAVEKLLGVFKDGGAAIKYGDVQIAVYN